MTSVRPRDQLDARVPTSSQNEAVRFYVRDSLSGTRSPWIALRGANFEFLPSSGSLIQTALGPAGSVGDWFRLRLVMDFTANGGSGRADAFSMNLTTGQTTFNPIPAFQNLDMGMLAAGTLASDWNALALRQDSPGFPSGFVLADNLVVVPEPSTGLLVALGIGTLACHDRRRGRRRRRRRRNDL